MKIHEVEAHWGAVVALGEATLALQRGQELILRAGYGVQAAASVDVLTQAANNLLRQMGQALVAQRDDPDPEVREFCHGVLDRLHPGWREAETRPRKGLDS